MDNHRNLGRTSSLVNRDACCLRPCKEEDKQKAVSCQQKEGVNPLFLLTRDGFLFILLFTRPKTAGVPIYKGGSPAEVSMVIHQSLSLLKVVNN